jgi:Flp pilus assembly protein TadD
LPQAPATLQQVSPEPESQQGGASSTNQKRPSGKEQALLLARQALDQGDADLARRHYARARGLGASEAEVRLGLIQAKVVATNIATDFAAAPGDVTLERCADELGEWIDSGTAPGGAYVERGRILLMLGKAEASLADLRQGAERLPDDAEAHSALGVALLATGNIADAIRPLRRAAELDPNQAARHTNLGTALLVSGDVAGAKESFSRAARLDPSNARTQSDLGTVLLAAGQAQEAVGHLERAVMLEPRRATFLSNLGYAYQQLGRLDRAIATCRRAIALDERLGSAWINLGIALAQQGDVKEARAAFQKAHELDPTDPRAKANLQELDDMARTKPAHGP